MLFGVFFDPMRSFVQQHGLAMCMSMENPQHRVCYCYSATRGEAAFVAWATFVQSLMTVIGRWEGEKHLSLSNPPFPSLLLLTTQGCHLFMPPKRRHRLVHLGKPMGQSLQVHNKAFAMV
jgi:hypothetical protein